MDSPACPLPYTHSTPGLIFPDFALCNLGLGVRSLVQTRRLHSQGLERKNSWEGVCLAHGQPEVDPQHSIGFPEHCQE